MNRDGLDAAAENGNVKAFLRAIRLGEGTSDDLGYRRMVGGTTFTEFDKHPGTKIWIENLGVFSSAAGAYQIRRQTWKEMQQQYDLKSFDPVDQDRAAIGLIERRKALGDVIAGRIERAIEKCNREWASLPGAPYGQRTESKDKVLAEYQRWGGEIVA